MPGQTKRTLIGFVLVSTSIFCVFLVVSMYTHFKKMESDFNIKKATLIKENLDITEKFASAQAELLTKDENIKTLEEDTKKLKSQFESEIATLQNDNIVLAKKLKELQERSLIDQLRDATYREGDEKVRKYFEKMLYNIVLVKSGKNIELEPIVVTKKEEKPAVSPEGSHDNAVVPKTPGKEPPPLLTGTKGKVISIDNRYNLVVIDLGRKDNIREGQRLSIVRSDKEIARAEVINVRYKIAAAFVDEIEYKYNIFSIHEGDEVIVED